MDHPRLFMNKSILSAFQVILCIVENLENRILIVVSLVVFSDSNQVLVLDFLSSSTDALKLLLYHHQ